MSKPGDIALEALKVATQDNIRQMWVDSIIGWAHGQRSRRIALRCADYEERSVMILADYYSEVS